MIRQSSSTMIRLASIIKEYEKEFIQKYDKQILPSHLKTLSAIKTCRSEFMKVVQTKLKISRRLTPT